MFVDFLAKMNAQEIEKYQREQFQAINYYRNRHGVPSLIWDQKIAKDAQAWANHLALEHSGIGKLEHSGKYGENLAAGYPLSNVHAANMWYSEVTKLDFSNIENADFVNKHVTQLIWKGSKRIGIGIAKSSNSSWYYVVANFDPPGNMMGSFAENVLPPLY
uniref:SCP domain-containing protein n=1 Tax=Panagrolaimus superbus TaxID=310955 RepID=A0A914Z753_9BILA